MLEVSLTLRALERRPANQLSSDPDLGAVSTYDHTPPNHVLTTRSQDTVGPMCRSVADAATILSVIAGRDPLDNFTLAQPPIVPDYTKALNKDALKGKVLGVPRGLVSRTAAVAAAFNDSLDTLRNLGATIVDPADFPDLQEFLASDNETIVLNTDFKVRSEPKPIPNLLLRLR